MRAKQVLALFTCIIRGHAGVPKEIEDLLFKLNAKTLDTECTRCHLPILLERKDNSDDEYFITEDP